MTAAVANNHLSGDGPFTKRAQQWMENATGCARALLMNSCTSALDLAAMLLDLKEGDEVILPSYTFVSSANAFVLRSAVPVFVDIREDNLNLDERLVEEAITPRTRAIVPVHYAGVACEMDALMDIARRHKLAVIEDAAQGIKASYKGRPLGSIGDLGALSFHATKNVVSGEGGSLLINDRDLVQRAEIMREKGTDRSRFFRGEVDKYTWQDIGSSLLPGDLVAAFLCAQLEQADEITAERLKVWNRYHQMFAPLEQRGRLRRPGVPVGCQQNGHIYYLIIPPEFDRNEIIRRLNESGIGATFHYVPLHSSPAGQRFGRVCGKMTFTDTLSERLIRLPLWVGINESQQARICDTISGLLDA